jgi:cytoskeletal protein RodZ
VLLVALVVFGGLFWYVFIYPKVSVTQPPAIPASSSEVSGETEGPGPDPAVQGGSEAVPEPASGVSENAGASVSPEPADAPETSGSSGFSGSSDSSGSSGFPDSSGSSDSSGTSEDPRPSEAF